MFHDVVVNLLIVLIDRGHGGGVARDRRPDQRGPSDRPERLCWGRSTRRWPIPAVQATEPRPEWYFLFLFELLRVFKTPWQLIFATIIIPTIMMVLLIAWPFLDRGRDRRLSRRPGRRRAGPDGAGGADRADDGGRDCAGRRRADGYHEQPATSTSCPGPR